MHFENKYAESESKHKNSTKLNEENAISQEIDQYVDQIAQSEGYVNFEVLKQPILTGNANFAADLFVIDIKGKTDKGASETNLFVKKIPSSERFKFSIVLELYKLELFAYASLYKVFTHIQDDAGIPIEMRFKMAKCYKESSQNAIILENAVKRGFNTLYKTDVMPLKFAELSVIELAKLHALSFVIKRNMPKYFDENLKKLKYPSYDKVWKELAVTTFRKTLDALEGDPCVDKLQSYMDKINIRFDQLISESPATNCCLCHGDYRVSNILAKITDDQVVDIIPVDYQLLYYGNPVHDFLYLVFLNSDQEFRRNNMTDLKNLYFDTLEQFLKYFDMDVEDVYPRITFEKDYKERLDFGLVVSLLLLPLLYTQDDDVVDLGADEVKIDNIDPKFNARIRGIVNDFIEWGYL